MARWQKWRQRKTAARATAAFMGLPGDLPSLEPLLIRRGKVRNVYRVGPPGTGSRPTRALPEGRG